jgi:hypothetical protein
VLQEFAGKSRQSEMPISQGLRSALSDLFTRAMTRPTIPLAATLALLATSAFGQVVYLNDQFTDLDRTNQSLPSSAQWTVGSHHVTSGTSAFGSLNASSGALVWDHTQSAGVNSFSAIWAHFANAGSPISLAIGETMTLSFDVSFANGNFVVSTGAFRFALLNSGGSRVTTDFAGQNATGISSGTTFLNWRGYEGQTIVNPANQAGNNFLTRERMGTDNGMFSTGTSPNFNWVGLSGSNVDEPQFTAGTTYSGFLSISRTGAGAVVQAGINGAITNSVLDATGPVLIFDTAAFFVLNDFSHDVTVDNVNVSVVPEPSSCCLLGAAALGLVRRRK